MTYYYILSIIGYPCLFWGVLYVINKVDFFGMELILIGMTLLLIKDILICQKLRELDAHFNIFREANKQ